MEFKSKHELGQILLVKGATRFVAGKITKVKTETELDKENKPVTKINYLIEIDHKSYWVEENEATLLVEKEAA